MNTLAGMVYESEMNRVRNLLNSLDYMNSNPSAYRLHNAYARSLRLMFVHNQTMALTNWQLFQLRQNVISTRAEFLLRSPNHSTYNTNNIGEITMESTINCHGCDTPTDPDDGHIIDNEAYCDDCVRICDHCEEPAVEVDMHSDGNTNLCEDCYDSHYITCEECSDFVHTDDYVGVQDSFYCQDCYESGDFHYCENAGENRHGSEDYCDSCSRGSDDYLHNYSYKPDPLFHDQRNIITRSPLAGARYFGVELETTPRRGEYRDDAAEYIGTNISEDILYLKEDSSISSGFEIVTHPMTLHWARNNFPWEMLDELEKRNMRAWNDSHCGLHIHINRTAFRSHSHLAKLLLFVYRNETEMIAFTGRHSHDYADYDSSERLRFVSRAKGETVGRRHIAINLHNDHTIELRVFRPSLKPTTVQAYLEFCDALVEYAGTITVEDCVKRNALTFLAFTDWLTTQTKEDYSILHARISKRVYQIA